ncbi:MAG TPA: glycosyltransferase, partial [Thermoanaerobaculia bacterium]|nr:glycosyltransferase [Thermoanaerobaculia bacterium]
MIVRDEAHVITDTLTSVAPWIDCWVIVDTGSADRTEEIIRSFFEARRIPGTMHRREWENFGTNRTEALRLCAGVADYAWVLDADDLVLGRPDLSALTHDSYLLRFGRELTYWRKQIFRTSPKTLTPW